MSKYRCPCGQTMSDATDSRPNAGMILKETDEERFYDSLTAEIAGFLSAVVSGRREAWIKSTFGRKYPTDLDDAGILSDLWTAAKLDCQVSIDECEACGRLHVQDKPGSREVVSYAPDSGRCNGVLRGSRSRRK